MKQIIDFIKDEEGIAMAEYVVLLVIIAVGLFAVVGTFRDSIGDAFSDASDRIGEGTEYSSSTE